MLWESAISVLFMQVVVELSEAHAPTLNLARILQSSPHTQQWLQVTGCPLLPVHRFLEAVCTTPETNNSMKLIRNKA